MSRDLLPSREEWRRLYLDDHARPLDQRRFHHLAWELDGELIGFSSATDIEFGRQALMHLHIVDPPHRASGYGTRLVTGSVRRYFELLELELLLCEPNALNTAPNRTLQRAGFRYELSRHTTPAPICPPQTVTRWRFERAWLREP